MGARGRRPRPSASVLFAILAIAVGLVCPGRSAASPSLGSRVVAFCQAHLGQKVGNGECAALAFQALKWAGAATRGGPDFPAGGDYVWGRQVVLLEASPTGPKLTGTYGEIQPGDVMQYRDVKFGKMHAHHHTAIVKEIDPASGRVQAFAQNGGGRRFVFEVEVPLARLTEGWIRIYRPIPR
jgi:hypothetical protein